MRVEDLDRNRVRPGMMERQLSELRWLGLDWDEGPDVGGPYAPYCQSERRELYETALARLDASGRTYRCTCSRREIAEAASAPHAEEDEGPCYPGFCRPEGEGGTDRTGRPAAVRFRVPEKEVSFRDLLHGEQRFQPASETGDFVIRRKDGVAAYQLAVVVDDAAMEITHVVRGADLLSSTARQILLYEALRLPIPAFLHVPLMHGRDGGRLSKREGAVTLSEVREGGASPQAVVGWLAASCGLASAGERTRPEDLVGRFEVAKLPRGPTRVDATPFDLPTAAPG